MIPGFGKLDPKKMQAMMSKLGIKQEPVDAKRVVIERDSGDIIIENPEVLKVDMQGRETWQIMGDVKEEEASVSDDDVKLVMEKTGKSKEEARKTLEETNGEVAQAIVKLSG